MKQQEKFKKYVQFSAIRPHHYDKILHGLLLKKPESPPDEV